MATYSRTQEIEHRIGAGGRFALRVTSSEVELRAVPGNVARVTVEFEMRAGSDEEADRIFEQVKFRVDAGEGHLEVGEPRRGEHGIDAITRLLGFGSSHVEAIVRAEVPAGVDLAFQGVSGDATVSGFMGTQRYQTVSGDLVIEGVGGTIQVRGVSGDISIRAEEPLALDLNTVSGDVSASAPRLDGARVVTVSGDIELEGELAPNETHRVETVSGDLSLGAIGGLVLEVRGLSSETHISLPHRSEGSRDRRRYVIGDGAASLQFSSMSGDASVHGPRRFPVHPRPPAAPAPPRSPASPAGPAPTEDEQLRILRALERGEIGIDEAAARLAGRPGDE